MNDSVNDRPDIERGRDGAAPAAVDVSPSVGLEKSQRPSIAGRLSGQLRIWIGVLIGAVFLWWAFRQVEDINRVLANLRQANYLLVLPAIGIFFLDVFFRSLRWQVLLSPMRRLPVGELFRALVIGFTVNDVLPARLGELARAYLLGRRTGMSKSAVLATIVVERLFDGITMFILLAMVGLFTGLESDVRVAMRVAGVIFLGGAAVLVLAATGPKRALAVLGALLSPVPSPLRARALAVAERFIGGLAVLQSVRLIGLILLLSMAAWGLEALMYLLIGQGFNLGVRPTAYLMMLAVVNLGTMIPGTPGYVGTFQGLSVFSLGLFGVAPDDALGYSFVLHAALLVPVTLMGFFYLGRYNLSLTSLVKERER